MLVSILDPGFATTVQDLGRYGYAHLGISPCGAADALSFRIAHLMVGNDETAPALEMTLSGGTFEFHETAFVAITGAECPVELNGNPVSAQQAFQVTTGSILKCGWMSNGARSYLAIQGGWDVPFILGSASTQLSARFGGFEGRTLRKGDQLKVSAGHDRNPRMMRQVAISFAGAGETTLRVTQGVQKEWFSADAFSTLFSQPFKVTDQCGRTGIRLSGDRIAPTNASQLLTDGVSLGAIQVPPEGQPIILFVDQHTTGGYPKIANVIAADMHLVGQLRPRDIVRFREVSIAQAVQLLREQEQWLKSVFEGE